MKKMTLIYCQGKGSIKEYLKQSNGKREAQLLVDTENYFDPRFKYRFISLEEDVKLSHFIKRKMLLLKALKPICQDMHRPQTQTGHQKNWFETGPFK